MICNKKMHEQNRQKENISKIKNNPFTNKGFWLEDHWQTQALLIKGKAFFQNKMLLLRCPISQTYFFLSIFTDKYIILLIKKCSTVQNWLITI